MLNLSRILRIGRQTLWQSSLADLRGSSTSVSVHVYYVGCLMRARKNGRKREKGIKKIKLIIIQNSKSR